MNVYTEWIVATGRDGTDVAQCAGAGIHLVLHDPACGGSGGNIISYIQVATGSIKGSGLSCVTRSVWRSRYRSQLPRRRIDRETICRGASIGASRYIQK